MIKIGMPLIHGEKNTINRAPNISDAIKKFLDTDKNLQFTKIIIKKKEPTFVVGSFY